MAGALGLVSDAVAVVATVALASVVSEEPAEATDGASAGDRRVVNVVPERTHILMVYDKISDFLSMNLLVVHLLEVLFK